MIRAPWDRRGHRRLKLPYTIVLHRQGEAAGVQTTTEDISSNGFYCISELPFSPEEKLECELVIPSQDLGRSVDENLVLHCRVEVVRVIADGLKPGYGLACRLKDYTIIRQPLNHPDSTVSQFQEV